MSRPLVPAPSKLLPRLIETIELLSLSSDTTALAAAQPLLSVDAIVENLRGRFAEYKRKPLSAFRATVERLCREQKASAASKPADDADVVVPAADIEADDSDVELVRVKEGRAEASDNRANDSIRALYASKQKASPSTPALARSKRKAVDVAQSPPGTRRKRTPAESISLSASASTSDWHPAQTTSTVRYSDIGGIDSILADIRELIEYPMAHPELYSHLGVMPPRGVLLNGPPGCGKMFWSRHAAHHV